MWKLRVFGTVAVGVFVFVLVQSMIPDVGIHGSSPSKPTYEDSASSHTCFDSPICKVSSYADDVASEHFTALQALACSFISACLVGLTGILPYVLSTAQEKESKQLNRLLSCAVGGLLGDVFLHLLPETWNIPLAEGETFHSRAITNGLCVLFGLICFFMLEKLFPDGEDQDKSDAKTPEKPKLNCNGNNNVNSSSKNGNVQRVGDENAQPAIDKGESSKEVRGKPSSRVNVQASGYLNLFANFIDNFTHGLAIGGSYLVSFRVGLLTTGAILFHELPHEFGDFAILLHAGFSRQKAAKYQLITASGGLLGALFAHFIDYGTTGGQVVAVILPFTSGAFMYIALCNIVPDLLKETTSLKESLIQLFLMALGVSLMGVFGLIE